LTPAGKVIIAAARDITQRLETEAALRESLEKNRALFRAAPVGISVSVNRIFTEVNDQFCEMLGYGCSEMLGMSARMLYPSEEEYERIGVEHERQIALYGSSSLRQCISRKRVK
jgi:PAS domain S-box-containing protein